MKASFWILLGACLAQGMGLAAFSNGDFESGTLNGWTVTIGGTAPPFGTQIAVTVSAGAAANTNGNLNQVYGGSYACMLDSGMGASGHAEYARISQSDVINSSNAILEFYYAAVLDGNHASTPSDDAYMSVEILNGAIPIVTNKYYYASSPAPLVDDGVMYKKHLPWTQILIDLTAYTGLTVTVQFTAYDCNFGGHNSTAYVDGFHFIPPSPTITPTATITPTHTFSPTISPTHSITPTFSITQSYTFSPTITQTYTVTPTFTRTYTPSITNTLTVTPSFSITQTHTHTPSITPTPTLTPRDLVLKLLPPNPNPTSEEFIWLPFYISVDSDVDIDIYTVAGEKVRHLEKLWTRFGYAERKWELKNDSEKRVASGTYLYRIRAVSARGEIQNDFSKCAVVR